MIVIVGGSSSGKSTLAKTFVNEFSMYAIIPYTTRAPRKGEVHGRDYYFVSKEEFEQLKSKSFFAETGKYRDYEYGTPKDQCTRNKVLVATPSGLRQLKKNKELDVFSVYLRVPRRDRLISGLLRGDDIEEAHIRSVSDIGQFDGVENEVDLIIDNPGLTISAADIAKLVVEHVKEK